MASARKFLDLQTVDLELDKRNARLVEIAERLGDEGDLPALRLRVEELGKLLREVEARQSEEDASIASLSGRIEAAEAKMYGGSITNPRELKDLQDDVAMLGRRRSEHEDVLLAALDELDATKTGLEAASSELAEAERAWKADQESMTAERGVLAGEVAALDGERASRAGVVPPLELALYERVRKTHAGRAVAHMRNSTCDSCRVGVPNKLAQAVRAGGSPERCPSCGLILLAE